MTDWIKFDPNDERTWPFSRKFVLGAKISDGSISWCYFCGGKFFENCNVRFHFHENEYFPSEDNDIVRGITHWQPLPHPPKTEGEG